MIRKKKYVFCIEFQRELNKTEFFKMYTFMKSKGMEILTVIFPTPDDSFEGDTYVVECNARVLKEFIDGMRVVFPDYDWEFYLATDAK